MENDKKRMNILADYLKQNQIEALPLLKVRSELFKKTLTASEVKIRLHIGQRQLNYIEKDLFIKKSGEKSKWRRYSIADLLMLTFYIVVRRFGKFAAALLFLWLNKLIKKNYEFLIHISQGKDIILFFDFRNIPRSRLFILPDQEQHYLKRLKTYKYPFAIIQLGQLLKDQLIKIAVSDFSADTDTKKRIIYKIRGEKIEIKDIPNDVLEKTIAKNALGDFSKDVIADLLSKYRNRLYLSWLNNTDYGKE